MPSFSAKVALVAFQLIWLNVYLPGHTRGVITIDSDHLNEDCDSQVGPSHGNHSCCSPSSQEKTPSPKRQAKCAICFFARGLDHSPQFSLDLRPLAFLHAVSTPTPEQLIQPAFFDYFDGRAPPAC
jgi:hypothetical protein